MTNPTAFNWDDPTTNTDGSAIAAGELTGYTIGIGTTSLTYTTLVPVTPGTAVSDTLASITPPLAPGTYYAAVRAESTNGSSAWSAEASFTIVSTAAPSAPTNFSVA